MTALSIAFLPLDERPVNVGLPVGIAAIAGAQLVSTEGLGHMKLLQDAAVLAEVTRFVARPLR